MKIYAFILGMIFMSALGTAQNGSCLEYKITSSNGTNGSLKLMISEFGSTTLFNMIIPQMPGGGMTMKSLSQKTTPEIIYLINDNNKTYSESKPREENTENTTIYSVKKLGEEIINGYKCVHALVTEGTETHEVWNTKDIPEFEKYSQTFKMNKRFASAQRERALKNAGCDGLPVKTIHKGNAREGDMTMELVKLEKKTFSKSDFDLPAGYTKTESAGMGMPQMKSQQELMNMTPEERAKYAEEMKKKYQR